MLRRGGAASGGPCERRATPAQRGSNCKAVSTAEIAQGQWRVDELRSPPHAYYETAALEAQKVEIWEQQPM